MPDLCHRNPAVYTCLLEYAEWLINEIGFDGFRFDFVKGYGAWMVRAIQELRGLRGSTVFRPFAVGECWDGSRRIDDWLDRGQRLVGQPGAARSTSRCAIACAISARPTASACASWRRPARSLTDRPARP